MLSLMAFSRWNVTCSKSTRTICEICSNVTVKTEQRHWCLSCVFVDTFLCLCWYCWTDFTYCFGVSIVDSEKLMLDGLFVFLWILWNEFLKLKGPIFLNLYIAPFPLTGVFCSCWNFAEVDYSCCIIGLSA